MQHIFCTFLCHCFARLKRETSYLQFICIKEELSYVLTKNFVACVPFAFNFVTAAHFHLAGR